MAFPSSRGCDLLSLLLSSLCLVVSIERLSGFVAPSVTSPFHKQNQYSLNEGRWGLDTNDGGQDDAPINKESRGRNRLKTHFDRLFLGTPSMQDILTRAEPSRNVNSNETVDDEEAWFEDTRKEIEDYYQKILQQMSAKLMEQRKQNPSDVPNGADEMLQAVLMQEMQLEIQAAKDSQDKKKSKATTQQDREAAANEALADLLRKRRPVRSKTSTKATRSGVAEYKQYEIEDSKSIDELLKARMEGQNTNNRKFDDDGSVEQHAQYQSITQPETMKEWQMYRSISSKLGRTMSAEEEVADRYQAWKDYVKMEELARKQAGLTRGLKMPFEWQEVELERARKKAEREAAIKQQGLKTIEEMRDEVDRKSIEALELLIQRTQDPVRSARLQNTLFTLRQELEASRLSTAEQPFRSQLDDVNIGPPMTSSGAVNYETFFSSTETYDEDFVGEADASTDNSSLDYSVGPNEAADSFARALASMNVVTSRPEVDESSTEKEGSVGGYSLGTVEEQKLRSLFQRAGARTNEDKEAVRQQWEGFYRYEQSMRDEFGLSETADAEAKKAAVDYDISGFTDEYGEIDAAKLLASIGPRPTRKRKTKGAGSQSPPDDEPAFSEGRPPTDPE